MFLAVSSRSGPTRRVEGPTSGASAGSGSQSLSKVPKSHLKVFKLFWATPKVLPAPAHGNRAVATRLQNPYPHVPSPLVDVVSGQGKGGFKGKPAMLHQFKGKGKTPQAAWPCPRRCADLSFLVQVRGARI